MLDYIQTDWGKLPCVPGAFDGVPRSIVDNVALYAGQKTWHDGEHSRPISRAAVADVVRGMVARAKDHYHPWESDRKAEADAARKALAAIDTHA